MAVVELSSVLWLRIHDLLRDVIGSATESLSTTMEDEEEARRMKTDTTDPFVSGTMSSLSQDRVECDVSWSPQADLLLSLFRSSAEERRKLKSFGNFESKKKKRKQIPEVIDFDMFSDLFHPDILPFIRFSRSFLSQFFREVNLSLCKISRICEGIQEFWMMKELILSGNELTDLEFLPPSLERIVANACNLSHLSFKMQDSTLLHIGIAYNRLSSFSWVLDSVPTLRNLISVDASFNKIEKIQDAIFSLRSLPSLRILSLEGNPCAYWEHYREFVSSKLRTLRVLDGVDIKEEEKHSDLEFDENELNLTLPVRISLDSLKNCPTRSVEDETDEEPKSWKVFVEFGFGERSAVRSKLVSVEEMETLLDFEDYFEPELTIDFIESCDYKGFHVWMYGCLLSNSLLEDEESSELLESIEKEKSLLGRFDIDLSFILKKQIKNEGVVALVVEEQKVEKKSEEKAEASEEATEESEKKEEAEEENADNNEEESTEPAVCELKFSIEIYCRKVVEEENE